MMASAQGFLNFSSNVVPFYVTRAPQIPRARSHGGHHLDSLRLGNAGTPMPRQILDVAISMFSFGSLTAIIFECSGSPSSGDKRHLRSLIPPSEFACGMGNA